MYLVFSPPSSRSCLQYPIQQSVPDVCSIPTTKSWSYNTPSNQVPGIHDVPMLSRVENPISTIRGRQVRVLYLEAFSSSDSRCAWVFVLIGERRDVTLQVTQQQLHTHLHAQQQYDSCQNTPMLSNKKPFQSEDSSRWDGMLILAGICRYNQLAPQGFGDRL